ncbi:NYN domain-containing protein [Clostridium sp. BJN0001]|uniref:NYN domain-containing protein n=1 Tax=Clostridium sp. BJN0001 TaxID=2930219 RepID=UPI001FCF856F|nr:NYN domain-containing protein [Clostridium sp. BJN0001]
MEKEKRFAVLIDADNVSPKYIKYILDEISNYGIITYKRIYGDWTLTTTSGWKEVLLENSISPIQQYSYTTGKNSTDSAMIIDAMDILYSHNVEGFCLVSSDSDFTRLAVRLRESGMTVIGMGEEKTPKPFSVACNLFKYLDILLEEDQSDDQIFTENKNSNTLSSLNVDLKNDETQNMTGIKIIEDAMLKIITENGSEEKGIDIGELGSRLVKRYPDFDVRNYGYTKLSKFLTSFDTIELEKKGNSINVHLKNNNIPISKITEAIIDILKKSDKNQINMGELNRKLCEIYNSFNSRNYGYTKFSKFINEIDGLKIISSSKKGDKNAVKLLNM